MFKRKGEGTTIDDFEGFGFGDAIEMLPVSPVTYHRVMVSLSTGKDLSYYFQSTDDVEGTPEERAKEFISHILALPAQSMWQDSNGLGGFARDHVVCVHTIVKADSEYNESYIKRVG